MAVEDNTDYIDLAFFRFHFPNTLNIGERFY